MPRPRIDPRNAGSGFDPRRARSRGFAEPPPRAGPLKQLFLFAWLIVRVAAASAVTAAFAALVLLVWFGFTMPSEPDAPADKTDAIVVLTGGEARIEAGYDLLRRDLARRMYITGVGDKVSKPDLMRRLGDPPAELAARVELGFRAADTIGNANETASWFNSQEMKSMRLVTANYHMRRSLLLFHRAMPAARILAHPVVPRGLGDAEWWTHARGVEVVAREMAKYFATLFHIPAD